MFNFKNGELVLNTLEDDINDPELHILTTLEAGNTLTDDLLLASTPEIETLAVKDSLPRKWTRKDIPIAQQEKTEFENTQAPIDVDLVPHKLFELFFDGEVINHLCEQSKIYANSKGNFASHVTSDDFLTFSAILLISGYTLVPRH